MTDETDPKKIEKELNKRADQQLDQLLKARVYQDGEERLVSDYTFSNVKTRALSIVTNEPSDDMHQKLDNRLFGDKDGYDTAKPFEYINAWIAQKAHQRGIYLGVGATVGIMLLVGFTANMMDVVDIKFKDYEPIQSSAAPQDPMMKKDTAMNDKLRY